MAPLSTLRNFDVLKYLWLLPLVAGLSWLITLSTLLIYWLAHGRPRYPGQSNPFVAFISDIAAFDLKPVFITGCTITAITFALTIVSVHYARYSAQFYGLTDDANWRKVASGFAMMCGLVASISLLLLTIFDTFRYHKEHLLLLLICFGGLAISSLATSIVWFDQTWKPSRWDGLRRWCIVSNILVVVDIALGVAFNVLLVNRWMHTAGFLEWALTYTGAFWLLTFVGYLKDVEGAVDDTIEEEQPLLASRDG